MVVAVSFLPIKGQGWGAFLGLEFLVMRATGDSMFIFFLGLFANLGFFFGLLVLVSAVI